MRAPPEEMAVAELGLVPYAQAFALQQRLAEARFEGRVEDCLLLLEHPATVTVNHTGRGLENLRVSPEELARRGVALERTDRGGNVTYHAPGQLVGYPIVALQGGERDLHAYLRRLEDGLIALAAAFGVPSSRVPGRTGTWRPDGSAKLAAIGVKVSRWVTTHGFALNVATDLGGFDVIVPCGIADAGVTSLEQELGQAPEIAEVSERAGPLFAEALRRRPVQPSAALRSELATLDAEA